jgi:hypothetical protein
MTTKDVLALALEALEAISQSTFNAKLIAEPAITAIKQAQQAEPVGCKPCRSPYCECEIGACSHPGFYDARGTYPPETTK